jgi:hypothetical protein
MAFPTIESQNMTAACCAGNLTSLRRKDGSTKDS